MSHPQTTTSAGAPRRWYGSARPRAVAGTSSPCRRSPPERSRGAPIQRRGATSSPRTISSAASSMPRPLERRAATSLAAEARGSAAGMARGPSRPKAWRRHLVAASPAAAPGRSLAGRSLVPRRTGDPRRSAERPAPRRGGGRPAAPKATSSAARCAGLRRRPRSSSRGRRSAPALIAAASWAMRWSASPALVAATMSAAAPGCARRRHVAQRRPGTTSSGRRSARPRKAAREPLTLAKLSASARLAALL